MIFSSFPRKRASGASAFSVRRNGGVKWLFSQRGAAKALSTLLSMTAVLLFLPAINQAASQRLDAGMVTAANATMEPVALPGLKAMDDSEMAGVAAQALFMASHERSGTNDFYKMGLDAQMDINVNIAELKLGEDASGVDLWIKNFAMGCIGATASPTAADCIVAGDGVSEAGKVLKPFTLLRPFIQVAVKNDTNPALREVVGIRLGAQNAQGPFSAGNFNSFSGYMSGSAALQMQGQGGAGTPWIYYGSSPSGCGNNMCRGVALTSDSDFRSAGVRWDHLNQSAGVGSCTTSTQNTGCTGGYNFGFANQNVGGLADTKTMLITFNTVNASGAVVANGKRLSQALVSNLNLADVTNTLGDTTTITATTSGLGSGLMNTFLPLLIGAVKTNMKNQLADGLGVARSGNVTDAQLNAYKMPFNLENFHSTMVDSSLFGLSFQKEPIQYPGYVASVDKGWAMYLPSAFTLNIAAPTTILVNNILNSTADTAGNITGLPANAGGRVYDNCWGTSVFC